MCRQTVIAVITILDQQLPVSARTVGLLAGDNLHSELGLIGHQVQYTPVHRPSSHKGVNRRIEDRQKQTHDSYPLEAEKQVLCHRV